MIKLLQTEEKLGYNIPKYLFDFIANLDKPEVQFGQEEWLFGTVNDNPEDIDDNFIYTHSIDFENEWSRKGLVFATNGIGDYLVMLRDNDNMSFLPKVFVIMHETAEIKTFADNWNDLIEQGPEDYFWNDEFYLKIDDNDNVVEWKDYKKTPNKEYKSVSDDIEDSDISNDFFDDDYKLRSHLDDLIDYGKIELTSEIIQGLEKLADCNEQSHKVWALNKLSDIYFKGFGPIPADLSKALEYNQAAINLNSHKAYSNRAACYFFGLGLIKDLYKALEYATKANELSKSNSFADILATKKDGGMYDNLVDMIEKEIAKKKD
ncbi:SMI1/KNR4 family protein [Terrimonas pollutisoli]|uniref:SMI1/KNR4 family protein n=1 Tax=Terrimonas pollutisoli TaxID=3034147 RepID=UPI0023EDE46E|nr:SMI1/KNR4 family protein [Terrimonas sp. H1YJ31]